MSRKNTAMGNLSTIQHLCHPHTLTKNLLPLSPYTFKCYLCNGVIKYSAYYCYKCEFYVHEHCVEACPLILNHPLHPQHSLHLKHGIELHFVCNGCGTHPWSRIAYVCYKCDFYLDFACAVSALHRKEEVSVPATPKIQYFGHEHPLMCFDTKSGTGDYCWVCNEEIQGEGCGCFVCKLFLHDRCFASMRPRTENKGEVVVGETNAKVSSVVIEHPLHSQHPLYLFIGSIPRQCHACKSFCPSSMIEEIYWCYVCDQCRFCLDISCVTKVVALSDPKVTIPPIAHEHRLPHFFAKEETSIKCVVCKAPLFGEFSGCLDCAVFFHNDCVVGVPETFEYSLHPEHPLTLGIFRDKMFQRCPSCSATLDDQLCYGCECGFAIHAECAQRMQAYHEEGNSAEISLSWHEHALRLCHRMHWDNGCSACLKSTEGLCYVCPIEDCQLFLHRSCTRLTSEIQHPHHLNHTLSLVPRRSLGYYTCDACHEKIWGFCFSCSKCAFYLDTKCASIIPDRKHVLHEHNLMRFEKIPSLKCNICGNSCDSEFYRCVACDFNIHLPCMELPRRIKPKDHLHTMVLYDYYVDDDSGEYYCDFCEQRRNPDLGVYLCEQCKMQSKLVAHIECALSKVPLSTLLFLILRNSCSTS